MLKAVIFDMDDTLLNWEARRLDWSEYENNHLRGVFTYLAAAGHPLSDAEAFVAEAVRRTEEAWASVGEDLRAPHVGDTLIETAVALGIPRHQLDKQALLRAYGWTGMPGVHTFPEVPDLIERLRGHGIKLGIVTNAYAPIWMRDQELRSLDLEPELFDCRVSSADVGYLKPHPAIFTYALNCLGVLAEEAIFVGDNLEADVVGAQGVGMRAVWRKRPDAAPLVGGMIAPDATISDLDELPAVLDRYFPGWQD
ncbi:MAG: HAD-IA family hydrolase [Anaerolineae bacterium]|nr:HAD-IA family hydrolase [Anaerolineae bacterium]